MKMYLYGIFTAACLTIAGCSRQSSIEKTSQQFNSLPPAVRQAVRSHAPTAEIASIDRKTHDNLSYYVIEFKEPGRNPRLTVADNGAIIGSETEKAMGSANPPSGTEHGSASKPAEPESTLGAPKGTTGRAAATDLSALPIPVQKTIKSQVPNGVITSIKRHEENGRLVYEFEFQEQGKNPTMRVAEDGTVVQSLKK